MRWPNTGHRLYILPTQLPNLLPVQYSGTGCSPKVLCLFPAVQFHQFFIYHTCYINLSNWQHCLKKNTCLSLSSLLTPFRKSPKFTFLKEFNYRSKWVTIYTTIYISLKLMKILFYKTDKRNNFFHSNCGWTRCKTYPLISQEITET